MSIDNRLSELGITLPQPAAPVASYVPAVEQGGLLHISGQISFAEDGSLIKGRLGEDTDLDAGIAAARRCGIMLLAQMKAALGSLDRVERVVKLGVFVNSAPVVHRPAEGRQRRLRADAGSVRRGRPPCAQRRRRGRAPARRRGRGGCDRRGQGLSRTQEHRASGGSGRRAHLGRRWPTAKPRSSPRSLRAFQALNGRAWDCARRRRSVRQPCLPLRARGFGQRRTGDRLDPRADPGRGRRRHLARRCTGLSEDPQPGRICVRPRLGRGVGARRRAILSQAAGRGAVHAGAGTAPARRAAAAASRRDRSRDGAERHFVGAHHLHRRCRSARVRARAAG